MLCSEINVQKDILDLGYTSTSNKCAQIFSKILDRVFLDFGETIQNGLIREAQRKKLPQEFKFPYYSLVEMSILDFMGDVSGRQILDLINSELTKQTNIKSDIEGILNEISRRDIFEMMDKFTGHEHLLYLWKDEKTRDHVLEQFFKTGNGPKRLVSNKKISLENVQNLTYPELFENKEKAFTNYTKMILGLDETNLKDVHSKLAATDGFLWIEEGFGKEVLKMETGAHQYFIENLVSGICAYDIKKIPNRKYLQTLISSHEFVLLDDPFVLYEGGN